MGYERSYKEKKKLKKLYESTKNKCTGGAWYNAKKDRYIKYSISDGSTWTKAVKKICNKKVRRTKDALQRGDYKKVHELRWIII